MTPEEYAIAVWEEEGGFIYESDEVEEPDLKPQISVAVEGAFSDN